MVYSNKKLNLTNCLAQSKSDETSPIISSNTAFNPKLQKVLTKDLSPSQVNHSSTSLPHLNPLFHTASCENSFVNQNHEADLEKLHQIAKNLPNILKVSKELSIYDILKKICVSPPYFAFKKIYQFEDVYIGKIIVEQPLSNEVTVISSAEASRHMAILGSCILSKENGEEKKYYLAIKARMNGGLDIKKSIETGSKSKEVYIIAKSISLGKDSGSSLTILVDEDQNIIFSFLIGYNILRQKLFERLFKKYYQEYNESTINHYTNLPKVSSLNYLSDSALKCVIQKIEPDRCSGHFKNYPVWPVGSLAYISIRVVEDFLKHTLQNDDIKIFLNFAKMDVFYMPSYKNDINFVLIYVGKFGSSYQFSWSMMGDENDFELYNTMSISFNLLNNS